MDAVMAVPPWLCAAAILRPVGAWCPSVVVRCQRLELRARPGQLGGRLVAFARPCCGLAARPFRLAGQLVRPAAGGGGAAVSSAVSALRVAGPPLPAVAVPADLRLGRFGGATDHASSSMISASPSPSPPSAATGSTRR